MILILSNKWDLSVDFVVAELRARGRPFLRLNSEDLVHERATVTLPELGITVSKQGRIWDLADGVRVIWNRRPGKPFDDVPASDRPSLATQRFVNDQWYSWLEVLQLLPDVTWVNHPHYNDRMESKIRQLWLAARAGFRVPPTFITNDPTVAAHCLVGLGDSMVAKALYSPLLEEPDQDFFIFSNEIREITPDDEEAIRACPCIFQGLLTPKNDYRVTVVGDTVISVQVRSSDGSPTALDWRTQDEGLEFVRCDLPDTVEDLCRSYVRQSGLLFGAIDLVEHDGEFFFLEINPNGEWGWLQKPWGLPIAETLCDLLVARDAS